MTTIALTAGAAAGVGMGYVLQRSQLCFHAMFSGLTRHRLVLARGWLLGVAIAAVGLALVFLTPLGDGLNRGLPFTPVANIAGGLVIGAGMAVARSCVSGLFFKLGAGMLGCVAGLIGWAAGELAVRDLVLPGPTVLAPGPGATFPGLLGIPQLVFALVFLALTVAALWLRRTGERPEHRWQWDWPVVGVALGLVTVAGWVLAGVGGSSFGPSSVGAVASVAAGLPNWWLIAFLLGIVAGAAVAARTAGGFERRGERPLRYLQLAAGGFLLGAGGWIAGGCNLGHGLSGVAQLNVASWVTVAAMIAGLTAVRGAVSVLTRRK
ncbi:YeeE/YedE thiosulfate transporter family protein [Amycolatopsis sp. H20-H5]|uniref:YeeE/YedE thiosulfate transporter family protein n=1 Tax=Amycolatopsis sp. H20-H5 TaxID=3046309 RepID=UPI002DB55AAC|nr:YeeE/YedE thiosulfate transporter family protein [Amycolatopsis sp. H20-H5]MEC3980369.1 YeeE/YedE thiosulfate transporter family protein [Amycolatopsis sp. H20-H5]